MGEAECHWVNIKTWNTNKSESNQRKGRLPCFHEITNKEMEPSPERYSESQSKDIPE